VFKVAITIPEDASADSKPETPFVLDPYGIVMNVSGRMNHIQLRLDVYVIQKLDIKLAAVDDTDTISSAGATSSRLLKITNDGNAIATIKLRIVSLPAGWYAYFYSVALIENMIGCKNTYIIDFELMIDLTNLTATDGYIADSTDVTEITLILAQDETAYVTLMFIIPTNTKSDLYELAIESEAIGIADDDYVLVDGDKTNKLSLQVDIRAPDLTIVDGIQYPKRLVDGDMATFCVTVKNIGEIDADEVSVEFNVDGKTLAVKTINLPLGQSAIVPFNWRTSAGKHKIEIVIDPKNLIIEADEDNNRVETTITIQSKGGWFGPGFELIAVIISLAIMGTAFITMKRWRTRPNSS
jgi:hypothetical protein